ncbi:MAG: MBOAT family protein [Alistipes sp.]|nr:MBOAT family protein [Alistipes sp.]
MLFDSYIFILCFLPLAFAGYFLFNRIKKYRWAQIWLIAMSLWFYGYFNIRYLWIICISIVVNFCLSAGMRRYEKYKKIVLAAGIVLNLALIFYFKYYNFFLENVNALFHLDFELRNIFLPLGISFFTFQQISFLADSYKGETESYDFVEYALFIVFFPQLVAGPIVLHEEMIPQFRDEERKRLNGDNIAAGLYSFAVGLFKKILLADTLGRAVTWGYETVWDMTSLEVLLVSLCYTFELYFDFSGYCDMASGIGRMFNIELPVNFNSPYKSRSVLEFWQRWHMTLTRFLKKYVYIPLGGSRRGTLRTYINVMVVFLLSGLWHGASWTFVVWGAVHGVANCLNRIFKTTWDKVWGVIRWICTFIFINCTWIIFRAQSMEKAWNFIKKLFCMNTLSVRQELLESVRLAEFDFLEMRFGIFRYLPSRIWGFHILSLLFLSFLIVLLGRNCQEKKFIPTWGNAVFTIVLMVWSVMSLSGVSAFLYFNF